MLIEGRIRSRLRERFATTLPRFDLMAQLERHPEGLRMGELSRRMMVTGGNVTGITAALVAEGLVERRAIPGDRRAHAVRLTAAGKRAFDAMAVEHERWVQEILGGIGAADRDRLHGLLGRLKTTLAARESRRMRARGRRERDEHGASPASVPRRTRRRIFAGTPTTTARSRRSRSTGRRRRIR